MNKQKIRGGKKPSLIQQNSDYQRGRRRGDRESKADQIHGDERKLQKVNTQ